MEAFATGAPVWRLKTNRVHIVEIEGEEASKRLTLTEDTPMIVVDGMKKGQSDPTIFASATIKGQHCIIEGKANTFTPQNVYEDRQEMKHQQMIMKQRINQLRRGQERM